MELLTREQFRMYVLALDNGSCCVPDCPYPAEDAHHIIERRLWSDGGYYFANGAPLCDRNGTGHHMDAEMNRILPQQLRNWCGHTEILLPPQLDETFVYNKWGKVIQPWNGKWPRTFHLPWSRSVSKGDRIISSLAGLEQAQQLVVTEKLDGECTTFTRERCHARSLDSQPHRSQNWVRNLWGSIQYNIPDNWRLVGENVYATHSLKYDALSSYFYLFAVVEGETILSWDDTLDIATIFDLQTPRIAKYTNDLTAIQNLQIDPDKVEGYVVRDTAAIPVTNWSNQAAKYVRADHVRTLDHGWRFRNDYGINQLAPDR